MLANMIYKINEYVRKFSFPKRVADRWNALPNVMMSVKYT